MSHDVCADTCRAMTLDDGSHAGFLFTQGRVGSKEFAAFTVAIEEGVRTVVWKRSCTESEVRSLRKKVYSEKAVRSITCATANGERCNLFFVRASMQVSSAT